ncbi:KGGVGR-motif variant AAA ATPase [Amycolatopsis sp. NPDC059090]|uniref:KGGVGR-motif variant AAA ATPase n=1 Tax=unclassified Amycolatopsis TaxID=2618356 RepID=UPI00366D3C2D
MTGTVITFYSFKGGVGRSFALANIAVLLARWGHRVLCVDWDLEAPGLSDYFRPMLDREPEGGVVDLVADFRAGTVRPDRHILRLAAGDNSPGTLDFLAAGRDSLDYPAQVQGIDWESLYDDRFGAYLEKCREHWTSNYDYVLLDSRTGISDVGGICAAHLPDRLVVLYTANRQSVRGAVDIAKRANVARNALPYDRPQLPVLPVLSRFDTREEYDRSEKWRKFCVEETESLFEPWLDQDVAPETMARHLTLPYVSYWTFGEQLPVLHEESPGADQVGFALETVAAVIAHSFDRTELLEENRDAYVAAVRPQKEDFAYDIQVSMPRSNLTASRAVAEELEKLGVQVGKSLSGDRSRLGRAETEAQHLCLVIDGKASRWQSAEAELFLHRTLGHDRKLILVLTEGTDPRDLSGYLGSVRYLRLGPATGPAKVARSLADEIGAGRTLVDTGQSDLVSLLRQAVHARLRPGLWDVVDDLASEMLAAVGAGDSVRAQELGADLAVLLRPRRDDDGAVPPPQRVRNALAWAQRVLDVRVNGS